MINKLKIIYRRQAFFPGVLGLFINPFYIARKGLLKGIRELSSLLHGDLLDVGCGTKPYHELFRVDSYIGLDLDSEASRSRGIADYFYDGNIFPFNDNEFDSLLCNQVLEHVFNPDEFLGELRRVLKPDGKLLLTVPFVWDEHEQPYDYARYSSFGLNALFKKNGFNIVKHNKIGTDASIIFQLMNAYIYKITVGLPNSLRILMMLTVMAPINFLGLIFSRILPKNPDLYLDHIVLAEKIT